MRIGGRLIKNLASIGDSEEISVSVGNRKT